MDALTIVCILQGVTLFLFIFREQQHNRSYLELLKLIRASSLSEFTAGEQKATARVHNYVKPAIEKAYNERKMGFFEDVDDD